MAIEAERLLAIFEAKFDSLDKALRKAAAQTKSTFGGMEDDGTQAEKTLAGIGAKGLPGIRAMRVETSNLAAQFNDIGVQLAGGQSPFLIALQQGTQISQALGPAGAGAAVRALGGAFASLINPVGLATIAIIAGGGYIAQYFLSLINGGQKSAETLQKEAQLIQQVADKWGGALPALRAYAEERQKLADQKEIADATKDAKFGVFEQARAAIEQVRSDIGLLKDDLSGFDGQSATIGKLNVAFSNLDRKIADQTATAADAKAVQDVLAQAMEDTHIPAANALAAAFGNLAATIADAASKAATFDADKALKQDFFPNNPLGTVPPVYSAGGRFENEADVQNDRANAAKSQFQIEQEAAARSTRQRADDYQRLTDRTVKQTAAMVAETEAQRQLNPLIDDYGYAANKARMEQDLLTAAQDAGKKITPELRGEIAQLADQYATASVEARKLAESQRDQARAAADAARFQKDLSRSIVDGFIEGKKASDILADSLKKLGGRLLDLAFDQAFDGKSGGGFLSNIFGSLFGGGSSGGGGLSWLDDMFRASGGPVRKGEPYIVGEKRPEVFVPDQSGTILPGVPDMSKLAMPSGGAGAIVVNFNPTIDNRGASVEAVARTQQQLDKLKAELPAHVTAAVRKAQKSNVKLS